MTYDCPLIISSFSDSKPAAFHQQKAMLIPFGTPFDFITGLSGWCFVIRDQTRRPGYASLYERGIPKLPEFI